VDRKLALSFGAVVLVLLLTVAAVAAYLYSQLQAKEEDRLSSALARAMAESISRVSFSGKYQARLLVAEMQKQMPVLVFISVETVDGRVVAHSDPSQHDQQVSATAAQTAQESLQRNQEVVTELLHQGRTVKEVVLPYRAGLDADIAGVVRLGIDVERVRREQRENLLVLLLLIAVLAVLAIGVVFILSRRFGTSVRALATHLQGILCHAPISIRIHDRAGRVLVQGGMQHLFGSPGSDHPALETLEQGISPPGRERLARIDREVLERDVPTEQEVEITVQDQPAVWQVSKFPIERDAGGHVSLICTFIRDITERKKAEQELRESEETLSKVVAAAQDAIIIMDTAGRIKLWNASAIRIFGYSADEVMGQNLHQLLTGVSQQGVTVPNLREFAQSGQGPMIGRMVELSAKRKTGEEFPIELSLAAVMLKGQWHAIGILRDITERKRAEVERERLQTQLTQAQKIESVGRLAGGVAHDFNNILGVILGHTELALEQVPSTEPLHMDLLEIQKAARRSADLTRQLLAFARRQTVSPQVLDLNITVEGMLRMLRRLLGEDLDLVWVPGESLWPVKLDPSQIDQVLANLCVNARDAITGVGKVTIETSNVTFDSANTPRCPGAGLGDWAMLAVSDTGCGMKPEVIEHIFEPFFTTKDVGRGTGLGLATVYGIVKQNNGFIDVSSQPGSGTMFRIYLPRHVGEVASKPAEAASVPAPCGKETVLIVEDELAILRLSKRVLEVSGYCVLAAETPDQAIKLAREHVGEIQLLVTDVVMPEMNGRDLAGQVMSLHPEVRCLFMSGYTADVIARQGVLEEGVHFIQKPFAPKDLTAKVRQVIDAPGTPLVR
jgi:PAS domain S-box-containing protein